MTALILGLALWWGGHLFKRMAPGPRAKMGNGAKGLVALLLILSVFLMVLGYKSDNTLVFWATTPALVGINNLLMLLAFYLFAIGSAKGPRVWLGTKLRHPQLRGFVVWAAAHLLVNGDSTSFVLFGGLMAWAFYEMYVINEKDGAWTPPERAAPIKEAVIAIAALGIMGVVMAIHNWLGVQPWG
jgi:uncharacterized membrane protein